MTQLAIAIARDDARQQAVQEGRPLGSLGNCAAIVRKRENEGQSVPLYQAMPLGVTGIEFRRAVPVAGPQQEAPGAIATWRAAGYGQVSFVRDEAGQWRIAK
jgi:hypothetical protein